MPELAAFAFERREVVVAYDSDATTKLAVQEAEERLARVLARHGAVVRRIRLPANSGEKVGLDDYLVGQGTDAVRALDSLCWSTPVWQPYKAPLSLDELLAGDYPPPDWLWGGFFLTGEVNLLYGDGGTGKSLLSLHLAAHVAAGQPLFNRPTQKLPVLCVYSEDGHGEVKARLAAILRNRGLPQKGLPIRLWCQPSDVLLADIDDRGRVTEELPRLEALRSELRQLGQPALVILDGMADLFAIDETSRLPVTAALKRVLGGLCRDFGATVLVLAHPSKASMQDGSHYSGSTAFNNGVRQRVTLERVKDGQAGTVRLFVSKSNYGAQDEVMLWVQGRSIADAPAGGIITEEDERAAILQTMLQLVGGGIRVVNTNSGNAGDARTLADFTKSVNERHGTSLTWQRTKDRLRQLTDVGKLVYRSADKSHRPHRKAGFERGPNA